MKFVTFRDNKTGKTSWGILNTQTQKIWDGGKVAPSLLNYIQGDWQQDKAKWKDWEQSANLALQEVTLMAPIPRPPSMRDGYAFRQHVEAARRNRGVPMIPEFDLFPIFYFTNHYGVIGPGACSVQSEHLKKLDFELETAIVVGKHGKNVKTSQADEYVFGLTIMNDFSARELQMEEMKMSLGPAKGKDFATALGPWLVTMDELENKQIKTPQGNQYDLTMIARHNGKEVSRGNMKDMHWSFAQILERVSYGVEIFPGDVIGSGTVGTGCYMELNGTHKTNTWLQPNDTIELEVEGLGVLTNKIQLVEGV